jgi:hypothetical protein
VGSVVAMSHAVHVEATRVLLDRFYRELVAGASIGRALDEGRAALIAQPHRWIELGPGGRTIELKDWQCAIQSIPRAFRSLASKVFRSSSHRFSTMLERLTWAAARASRRNCSASTESSCPVRGIFTATVRSSSVSFAFQTLPKAPSPTCSSN